MCFFVSIVVLGSSACAARNSGLKHGVQARTIELRPGETRRFIRSELPPHSVIQCVYHANVYRFDVPSWSVWRRGIRYGWVAQGSVGTGEGWLGVRPVKGGAALVASCRV